MLQRTFSSHGRLKPNAARTYAQVADAPSRTSRTSSSVCGWKRHMNASISTRPARSAASNARSTCAGSRAIGFSHSTCLPASSARIDHSTCIEFGSGM